MSLTQAIEEFRQGFLANVPKDIQSVMGKATEALYATGIESQATKSGDKLLDVTLPNHKGEQVSLHSLLKDGPLVISFYRGGWCPYCNIELKALQDALPEITELGAKLVAITPELPDESLNTVEKNGLNFNVLTDLNAEYAKKLGLVFTLPEELRPIYQGFGIDLEKHNGQGQFDLPLPATLVVSTDGDITFAFADADYTKRLEPAEVIKALKELA